MSDKTLAEWLRDEAKRLVADGCLYECADCSTSAIALDQAADALDAKDDRIEHLEAALRKIADQDVPFYDGYQPNVCIHRRTSDQDCPLCTAKYARDVLAADEGSKP